MKRGLGLGAVLTLVLGALCCGVGFGAFWMFEVPLMLLTGWARFVARVAPEVQVNPAAVAEALVTLLVLAVGLQLFMGWLQRTRRAEWRVGQTLGLLAGVVGLFATSIASAGLAHQLAWLLRSPEPLVASTWERPSWKLQGQLEGVCRFLGAGGEPHELRARLLEPAGLESSDELLVLVEPEGEGSRVLAMPLDEAQREEFGLVICHDGVGEEADMQRLQGWLAGP